MAEYLSVFLVAGLIVALVVWGHLND